MLHVNHLQMKCRVYRNSIFPRLVKKPDGLTLKLLRIQINTTNAPVEGSGKSHPCAQAGKVQNSKEQTQPQRKPVQYTRGATDFYGQRRHPAVILEQIAPTLNTQNSTLSGLATFTEQCLLGISMCC